MTTTAEKINCSCKRPWPTREEAVDLWEEGIHDRCLKSYGFPFEDEYRFHTQGVARAAEAIAAHIPGMNSEKAFVLGLLHDYGKKINERMEGRFHGREGYEKMLELGYPEVAKICLTHTFPKKNFEDGEFSYPEDWQIWCHKTLANIEYDDYDYLIGLCDKFFEGMSMVSIENRIKGIVRRYQLSPKQEDILLKDALRLKAYFDKKTGCDIYDILGIKE